MSVKSRLRAAVFLMLRVTGIPALLRRGQRNKLTIVCLHDPYAADLERIANTLRRSYTLVGIQEWLCNNLPQSAADKPLAAITLDDGHRNNIALRDCIALHNIPLTIYLCSSIVGTHRHYWWTNASDEQLAALKVLPNAERLSCLADNDFSEQTEYPDRQALRWEDVDLLSAQVDFQAHTRFHPVLPFCDNDTAAQEIAGCKQELESRGLPVSGFAYPNGDYCDRDAKLVEQAGFSYAVTLDSGSNDASTDPYRLRRTVVEDDVGNSEIIVKMSGLWDKLMSFLGKKRPYGYKTVSPT